MSAGNNKFSRELQTSKRTRLTEQRITVEAIGAWNPDATDASRSERDFAEVRNMRKMRPNELETRSGYKQWAFGPWLDISDPSVPGGVKTIIPTSVLAKGEYRLNSVFVDITLFTANYSDLGPVSTWIYALIVQPSQEGTTTPVGTQTPSQADVVNPAFSQLVKICPCDATPVAACKQFGTYFVVSALSRTLADPLDTGMYALSPAANDITLQQPWTITTLGKTVSPCPNQYSFSPVIQGPLLALVQTPAWNGSDNPFNFSPQIDPATNLPITIPIPLNANYFLTSTHRYPLVNPWEFGKTDAPTTNPVTIPSSGYHTQSRGWMYRVVVKSKFNDARGQEHIESQAPSADFYVPDMTYGPATLGFFDPKGETNIPPGGATIPDNIIFDIAFNNSSDGLFYRNGDHDVYVPPATPPTTPDGGDFKIGDKHGSNTKAYGMPSADEYIALSKKFQALYPTMSVGDSLVAAAVWLGWVFFNSTGGATGIPFNFPPMGTGTAPYLIAAKSYQVNAAPNTVFNWNDFGITDLNAYAIDIYRTTYTLPDETLDLAAGLPYQPYNYGYVGTLYKTDTTFTDNIADANLLFSQSPLDAEGFLAGELAGEVLQAYQGSLVLGNVRSKYRVRTPWQAAQAILVGPVTSGNGYSTSAFAQVSQAIFPVPFYDFADEEIEVSPSGIHWLTSWYYAYQDQNGVLSNASYLLFKNFINNEPPTTPNGPMNAAFVLPRGYSTLVTAAVVYRVVFNPSSLHYDVYREATVQLMNGIYISDSTVICTPPPSASSNWIGTINLIGSTTMADSQGFIGTIGVNADGSLDVNTFTSTDDPGSIFWSDAGDAWSWPEGNFEDETDQDPIMAMDSEIGPLYCFSDKGIVMTRLNGYQEPVHTSGTGAGCLSRYGFIKIDAELFSLASCGMTRIDGSGSFAFPANIQSQIWTRLQEKIKGQSPFTGIRDMVCMSYLPKRGEMFISFPSTIPLGGVMPAATFIVKTLVDTLPDNPYRDEITRRSTYQFDLAIQQPPTLQTTPPMPGINDLPAYTGTCPQPAGLVIHCPHADGGMWSAWYDPGDSTNPNPALQRAAALIVQDNDRPELPWPGQASLQWQNSVGAPGVQKRIDGFRFNGQVQAMLYFLRGMLRTDGMVDPLNNTLRPECVARQVAIQGETSFPALPTDQFLSDPSNPNLQGNTAEYLLSINHNNAIEAVGTPPAIRLVTRPVTDLTNPLYNQHMLRISSMDVWYDMDHNHKP